MQDSKESGSLKENLGAAELKIRIQKLERLNQIVDSIHSEQREDIALHRIIEEGIDLLNANQGSIVLIGQDAQREIKTLIREHKTSTIVLDHFLNNLITGWVLSNNTALISNNPGEVFRKEILNKEYAQITSILSTPLMHNTEIIGTLNFISTRDHHKFNKFDLTLTQSLAKHCVQFIQNARLRDSLFTETLHLKNAIREKNRFEGIIGASLKMQEVFALLEQIIKTDVRVLLEGESGTGKEQLARIIHANGLRKDAAYVAVDCGALPAGLLESELFGSVKGAFTGADKDRIGLFEEANGGTIFLDEIANMPLDLQSKFLRVIQEGEVRPLGTSKVRKVDVRIIAAASQNLRDGVKSGKFREDLFYRLNVVNVCLPPLRERKEDIVLLADHFRLRMNEKYHKEIKYLTPEVLELLESYHWPGNIRELEHMIERAVVLCDSDRLSVKDFNSLEIEFDHDFNDMESQSLQNAVNQFKKKYITHVLKKTNGVQSKAAKLLEIQRTYLNRLIKELAIKK